MRTVQPTGNSTSTEWEWGSADTTGRLFVVVAVFATLSLPTLFLLTIAGALESPQVWLASALGFQLAWLTLIPFARDRRSR
jgi:hypothetical protein